MSKIAIVKVQKSGRIRIPIDLKKELDIQDGDLVKVSFEKVILEDEDEDDANKKE